MTEKKKIVTEKQLKNLDTILRWDENTFYVPRESNPDKQPYLVYHSANEHEKWLCDCMSFVMALTDDGKTPECKHIRAIKKRFNIQ